MRSLIRSHKLGLALILVGVIGMVTLATTSVQANHAGCANFYNRCVSHGYFTGQNYNIGSGHGTYVMSGGQPKNLDSRGGMPVYNVNEFVGYIHNRLYDGAPGDANAKYQDTTGAAFIVNTMLGRWGTDYGSRDAGVIYARNNFAVWERSVRWYDSQGLIEWDRKYSYPAGFENSLYARDIRDEVYVNHPEYQAEYTIMIHAPGHGPGPGSGDPRREFQIKKNCGNPIGANTSLRQAPEPEGAIQGYKVVDPGDNPNIEPPRSALITASHKGGRTTRNNPYFFTDVPADSDGPGGPHRAFHRVTAEAPAGWRVGYNICYDNNSAAAWRNPCDNGRDGVTWSNTVVVDVYVGNPVNVWWHYERLAPPPPDITAQCTNGNVTAQIRWNTGVLPPTRYMVDIDDANNFNQFWNKDVPQGSNSTNAPEDFRPYPSSSSALTLRRGQQYFARVYYVNSNEHSQVRSFTAPSCWQFTIPKPTASAELKPDDEDPENVDLRGNFVVNYSPSGPPNPQGLKLSVTRSYYINKANGTRVALTPNPTPNPDNRWFNGSDINGASYSQNRNLPSSFSIGDEVCVTITVSPGSGSVDSNGNVNPSTAGPAVTSEPGCDQMLNKPYFRVYGGDISAGSSACRGWSASNIPGMITAFNSTATPGKGSGTQLAALAIGAIHEFSSATGRTAAPVPPKGLAFANVSASGAWGGSMGVSSCPHDYFGTQQTDGEFTGPDFNVSGWNRNMRTASGVRVSGVVDLYNQVTLYVDGDAVISDNISYALPPAPRTGWSYTEIPNFTLVARGNIYIGSNVTEMAGTYIAQPKNISDPAAGGGEIYTCAFGMNPPTEAQLTRVTGAPGNDNCRNQLTINGSFIAKRVRLLRTNGSLKDSAPNENRASTTMGERFIFSPEAWLSSAIRPIGGYESYDAITTLPPVL